jgi:selenocysteine lyase/cysteine desulfurase
MIRGEHRYQETLMKTEGDNGSVIALAGLRKEILGIDTAIPLLDGTERPYVFLDNAASTPTFRRVLNCVTEFLPWYSSVHRGTGFKSLLATEVFDRAHDIVAEFVGADPSSNLVIFTKNTTEAVNKLSNRFGFGPGDVVITTGMEHHSNDLPWRKNAKVVHIGLTVEGRVDLGGLKEAIEHFTGQLRLVAVSGASNITGICQPIHEIAGWAHDAGAAIFVDAAQLAPHRRIQMFPNDDTRHIDFLAFSAHKMYAPFGTGVLVGPMEFFEQGDPDMVGGGVVDVVTLDSVVWNQTPHKDEAGTPNVVGAVALAEAIAILQSVGMETIAAHEQHLLDYAYRRLRGIKGVHLYGPTADLSEKVGVIPFTIEGFHHALVAAILATEGGIGVRNGFFCAQPYVKRLLNVTPEEEKEAGCGVGSDKSRTPGLVRASLGCYSNEADVDAFLEMVEKIVRREYKGNYHQDSASGVFNAKGFEVAIGKYFSFLDPGAFSKERTYSEAS